MHSKFQPVLTQLSLSQVFSGLPCAFIVSMQPEMCGELISAFLQLSYLQDLLVKLLAYFCLARARTTSERQNCGCSLSLPNWLCPIEPVECSRFFPRTTANIDGPLWHHSCWLIPPTWAINTNVPTHWTVRGRGVWEPWWWQPKKKGLQALNHYLCSGNLFLHRFFLTCYLLSVNFWYPENVV